MYVMAVASGAIKSTLNPNAPLFVPAAFQRVEDYSPEWWELVKTTSWFRDYWFHEHQQQENIFDASHQFVDYDNDDVVVADDDNDIANLLPESLDLGILEDEAFHQTISLTHNSGKRLNFVSLSPHYPPLFHPPLFPCYISLFEQLRFGQRVLSNTRFSLSVYFYVHLSS